MGFSATEGQHHRGEASECMVKGAEEISTLSANPTCPDAPRTGPSRGGAWRTADDGQRYIPSGYSTPLTTSGMLTSRACSLLPVHQSPWKIATITRYSQPLCFSVPGAAVLKSYGMNGAPWIPPIA